MTTLSSLAALALAACSKPADKPAAGDVSAIKTMDQKVSYGIGYNMGKGLGRDKLLLLDRAAFNAGLEDGLAGTQTRIAEADLKAAFAALQQHSYNDRKASDRMDYQNQRSHSGFTRSAPALSARTSQPSSLLRQPEPRQYRVSRPESQRCRR